MPEYRFYDREQSWQIVGSRIDLNFKDDMTAIAHGEELINGEALEVWEGDTTSGKIVSESSSQEVAALRFV
jgi:hypothetical protein